MPPHRSQFVSWQRRRHTQTRRFSLLVPPFLTAAHLALAKIHPDFYDIPTTILAATGVVTFTYAALRATHNDIQRLTCTTLGLATFLAIGILALPILDPDWRGDRLCWFQYLTPFVAVGALLGSLASRWQPFRSIVDNRLHVFLVDRRRVSAWAASIAMFYFISASTFAFDAPRKLMNESYGKIFDWLPAMSFQVSRFVGTVFTLQVTIAFVVGLPAVIILFVGADTILDQPRNSAS